MFTRSAFCHIGFLYIGFLSYRLFVTGCSAFCHIGFLVYRLFCISAFCISAFCSWLLAFCHIGFLSYRLFVLSAYWYRLFDRRLFPLGFWPRIVCGCVRVCVCGCVYKIENFRTLSAPFEQIILGFTCDQVKSTIRSGIEGTGGLRF
jgi:hypothetical protein